VFYSNETYGGENVFYCGDIANESFPEIIVAIATTNIDDTVTCAVGGARIGRRTSSSLFRVWLRANGKNFPAAELTSRADNDVVSKFENVFYCGDIANESFPEIIVAIATTNIDDTVTCAVSGARIGRRTSSSLTTTSTSLTTECQMLE